MSRGRARLARYAPAVVSALALGGVAWWAGHQQLPALPAGRDGLRALAAATALYALATLVRCERWHQILARTGVASVRADAYGLVTVGYMANNTLVARAGDVLKVEMPGAAQVEARLDVDIVDQHAAIVQRHMGADMAFVGQPGMRVDQRDLG